MKFTVNRNKWRCGGRGANLHGKGRTELLNTEEYMCCLGFCMEQEGFSQEDLERFCYPRACAGWSDKKDSYFFRENIKYGEKYYIDSDLSKKAYRINDDNSITREEREEKLIALFNEYGHEITFEGEYEDAL